MEQYGWVFWLILGVILLVAETFTLGFVLMFFGIGALVAAVTGLFGVGLLGQFLVFAAVSVALTLASRTIFSSFFGGGEEVKLGVDALPGRIGTVTSGSVGALNEAAVKVFGSEWTAFPEEGGPALVKGEKVEVVSVRGSSIYVRPVAAKQLPDWRGED